MALMTMSDPGYTLRWYIHFELFMLNWFADKDRSAHLLDTFASSAWFAELDHFGIGGNPGVRFASMSEVRELVISGLPGQYTFARGSGAATTAPERAEAAVRFELLPRALLIQANARGDVLGRLHERALDDIIRATVELDNAWREIASLAWASATPSSELAFSHVRPVRKARSPLHSIAEVFSPTPPERAAPQDIAMARAMAGARPPAGVERTSEGRLIVQRWVRDPSDPMATAEACSRHQAWLASLLDLPLAPGWNAAGEQRLAPGKLDRAAAPLELYDPAGKLGFQRVARPGDDRWSAAEAVLASRRLADGREVTAVILIAPDAAAAAQLRGEAGKAGFTRVVYPDSVDPTVFWDPHPPGSWILVPRKQEH